MNSGRIKNTRQRGASWERVAETFLRKQGLKPLERNYACKSGEIDLIMKDRDMLVFVEVRFRRRTNHGSGMETVGKVKQRRLISAARLFLSSGPRLAEMPCRFDVVSVTGEAGHPRFDWIRNAFDVQEGMQHVY